MTSHFSSRRQALLSGGALVAGLLAPGRAHTEEPQRSTPTGTDWQPEDWLLGPADALHPEADSLSWDPLGRLLDSEDDRLHSITLVPAAAWESPVGLHPKSPVNLKLPAFLQVYYEETDSGLMEYVTTVLSAVPPLCQVPQASPFESGGGGLRLALLRMRTTSETFWISITRQGFGIGDRGVAANTVFYSATLTRALQLIYKKATGEPLPQYFVEHLSGEDHIRRQFASFDRWQASQK